MATRPIVPRANGEGSLGVSTAGSPKYWGDVFTNRLNNADAKAMASRSTATLRAPFTNYSSGAKCVAAGLPANFLLVCTVGGTTANADITLPATIADTVTFVDGSVTWQIQEIITSATFAFRQPSASYDAGSIVYCTGLPTGWYLECSVAGITDSGAITLPATIVENAEVTDGTITWKIRKIGSGGGEAVGVIKAFAGNGDIPSGYLLCDGSAVSRTMFPDLFSAIGTTYGAGDGSTTFNLPDYNTAARFAQGGTVAGVEKEAGLPNIEGDFLTRTASSSGAWAVQNPQGAFTNNGSAGDNSWAMAIESTRQNGGIIGFDASASNPIYGNSTTVQPNALTTRYIIKAFDGQTADSALIDITQYAQELAGKANITGSNMVYHRDVITPSGTYTAPITGLYKITVKGGGGGGGGGYYTSSVCYGGAGGGEGGTTIAYEKMTVGDTAAIVIGAGGAGGAAQGGTGTNGGNSTVTVNSSTYTGGGGYAGGNGNGTGGSGTIMGMPGGSILKAAIPNSLGAQVGSCGGGQNGGSPYVIATYGGGGAGGLGQTGSSSGAGSAGGNGYVWFEYYTPGA